MRLTSLFLLACLAMTARGQQSAAPYSFEWEVVAVDSIPGMTTVRLYAVLVNPGDYLTSVSGWDEMDGRVETTTSFYQDPDGWATPNNNNPLLYDILPTLRYDSWVTIGIDAAPIGAEGEIPVGLFPPETSFWVDEFEAGGDLVMDIDGAWFVTLGSSNGTAGEDLRVLVGQFTTDGVISGYLNLQVFSNGVASDEFMDDVHSILIPEFDAGALSEVSEREGISWATQSANDGGYMHVIGEPCQWTLFDLSGREVESGWAPNGRFISRGGILRLTGGHSGRVIRRWFP